MMLLKGFVLIFVLLCIHFISCDAEELNKENTTVTNDAAHDTKKTTVTPTNDLQNSTKNTVKLKFGRSATEHFPVTKDGYILKIFRLHSELPTKNCPVLLVHGLFQSSDRFLNQNQSLAFKLQDLGYDVWLFNARGNKYSRGHVKLSPEADKTEFFDYSFEEIGCFDLSATVDYILTLTQFKKMHYIGHSLGGTFFLVLNSLIPRYNEKFDKAFLLAPLAYHKSFPHQNLKKEFVDPSKLHKGLLNVGTTEIFPYSTGDKNLVFIPENCLGAKQWVKMCNELKIQTIMGLNSDNNTIFDTRGGSIKTLIHWAQNVKSKQFRRWDFGEIANDKEYGAGKSPPEFPLNAVTVMTKIIYTPSDEMVNDTDIAELAMQLKNATTRKVKSQNFKHDDFFIGKFVMTDVYNGIIRDLPKDPKNFVKRKMKAVQKLNGEVDVGFPWVSVISLVMTFVFMIVQIVECCKNKKRERNNADQVDNN